MKYLFIHKVTFIHSVYFGIRAVAGVSVPPKIESSTTLPGNAVSSQWCSHPIWVICFKRTYNLPTYYIGLYLRFKTKKNMKNYVNTNICINLENFLMNQKTFWRMLN